MRRDPIFTARIPREIKRLAGRSASNGINETASSKPVAFEEALHSAEWCRA